VSRTHRTTLADIFIAVRDGTLAAQLGGRNVWPGGLPEYVHDESSSGPKTGEDLFRDFGHLIQPRQH
jgi:hypothetical protein